MSQERTFSIIKPDAIAKNHIGEIYSLVGMSLEFNINSAASLPDFRAESIEGVPM